MNQHLPAALLDALERVKGFDRKAFQQVHASRELVTSIRLNPFKSPDVETLLFGEGLGEAVPWCPHGKYLTVRPSFTLDPLLHGGAYYVQEASSMFLWHALEQTIGGKTAGLRVLD
ncbi:MAG: RNA methyltransferase, partial [Panacibacter sp.]